MRGAGTPIYPAIDVAIVAGRRPKLLGETLASFQERLFSRFEVRGVYANIDPVFGDADDHRKCVEVIRGHFPDATIREPNEPSFGGAVKFLWGQVRSPYLFHLEDDWIALEDFDPNRVFELFDDKIRMVIPVCKEFGWDGKNPIRLKTVDKKKFLGLTVKRIRTGYFGTSPRFIERDFAVGVAQRMNPDLDPEKQMRSPPRNRELIDFILPYRSILMPGTVSQNLIEDIGRLWRVEREIDKELENGISVWSSGGQRIVGRVR